MRKHLLSLVVILSFAGVSMAQNKSLGVGTATPNPNAALHVESPTNNQGFIMPRLTTAQREGMGALLTTQDAGLMLYDTELQTIYIWSGTEWRSSAQVAGGARLQLPYADTLSTDQAPNTAMLRLVHTNPNSSTRLLQLDNTSPQGGTAVRVSSLSGWAPSGFFINQNDTSSAVTLMAQNNSNKVAPPGQAPAAVYGVTTGTSGIGGAFRNLNAANTIPAASAETNGLAAAMYFGVNNTENTAPALNINHQGTGVGILSNRPIQAPAFIGDGSQLTGINGGFTLPYADTVTVAPNLSNLFDVTYSGTDTVGIVRFRSTNPNNTFATTFLESQGGRTIYGHTFSPVSPSAEFRILNSTNTASAIIGTTTGRGSAGRFIANNATSPAAALYAENNGDSLSSAVYGNHIGNGFGVLGRSAGTKFATAAVYGEHTGTGDAAGAFRILNNANPFAALYGETNGTGSALRALQLGTGNGLYVQTGADTSSTNNQPTIFAAQLGLGRAGQFQINNNNNTNPAIRAFTSGLSNAGFFTINNPNNTFPSIFAETNGQSAAIFGQNTGTSNAGRFVIPNAANNAASIFTSTVGNGSGIDIVKSGTAGSGMNVFMQDANGSGSGLTVNQIGTNTAISASTNTATDNFSPTIFAGNNSTGNAINAITTNPNSPSPAILAQSNSQNGVIEAIHGGTVGDGIRLFMNPTTVGNGLAITQNGSGGGMRIDLSNTPAFKRGVELIHNGEQGEVAYFEKNNINNDAATIFVNNNGGPNSVGVNSHLNGNGYAAISGNANGSTGHAAYFFTLNPSNTSSVIEINNLGAGRAINANGEIAATAFVGDGSQLTNVVASVNPSSISDFQISESAAISGTKINPDFGFQNINTTGDVSAGNFIGNGSQLTNLPGLTLPAFEVINTTEALLALENTGTGPAATFINSNAGNALEAQQTNNGIAFRIIDGGMRLSNLIVSDIGGADQPSAFVISQRAYAFYFTDANTAEAYYQFNFTLTDGDTFFIINEAEFTIYINGKAIDPQSSKTIIYLNGQLRG